MDFSVLVLLHFCELFIDLIFEHLLRTLLLLAVFRDLVLCSLHQLVDLFLQRQNGVLMLCLDLTHPLVLLFLEL